MFMRWDWVFWRVGGGHSWFFGFGVGGALLGRGLGDVGFVERPWGWSLGVVKFGFDMGKPRRSVGGDNSALEPDPPTLCLRDCQIQQVQDLLYKSYSHYTLTMESLLSLSFDYLSSNDGVKIRKGLRQLEGLLAQICLSRSSSSPADRRSSVIANGASKQLTKELSSLKNDPAFREFFKLQEGFEWNGKNPGHPTRRYH